MVFFRSTFALLLVLTLGEAVALPRPTEAGVGAFDRSLYETLHSRRHEALDVTMGLASEVGNGYWLLATSAALWAAGARRDGRDALIAVGSMQLGTTLIKAIVNRQRPNGAHSRYNSSFPSGHAATAAALATVLTANRHGNRLAYGVPLGLFAAWVGYSRIYNGRHYPLDVIVGGALGLLGGQLTVRF